MKRKPLLIGFLPVVLLLAFAGCNTAPPAYIKEGGNQSLTMREGQDFKILTVTDSHVDGKKSVEFLIDTIDTLVEKHDPDLVILNGDNVDHSKHLKHLDRLAQYFEQKRLYWAAVMGNHDRDPRKKDSPEGLLRQNDFYLSYNAFNRENGYCLYVESEEGYADILRDPDRKSGSTAWHSTKFGNYAVQIKDAGKTVYSLIFLDSGQHDAPGSDDNGYIEPYQVEWYEQYIRELSRAENGNSGNLIPSLVFLHQPVHEYLDAAQYALKGQETGIVSSGYGFGANLETIRGKIQKEGVNHGLFDAMKAVSGTHIFAGHNHSNNSSIYYDGIWVNYLNRVGRRGSETKSVLDERVNFSKLITIRAGSYDVDMNFALPDGRLTKNIQEIYTVTF